MNDKKMIFLVSLPRSGSTLLQKMLSASPEIHSTSEPWLMLPFANMLNETGALAPYGHQVMVKAIDDMIELLPNKKKDFYSAIEEFTKSVYSKTDPDGDAVYFLDKTPRYYMILPFLAEAFPEAKFIFLFRNPLEVLSSILTSWKEDKLVLIATYLDLYGGPAALAKGYRNLKERSISVNYRELIGSPEAEIKKICEYLDIPFEQLMLTGYKDVELKGKMGDQHGVHDYKELSTESLSKWKRVLNTRYRKWYSKRLVRSIGDKNLKDFGYTSRELITEINSIKDTRSGSIADAYWHLFSYVSRRWGSVHLKKPYWPFFYR